MWLSSLTAKQREALLGLAHNIAVSDGLLDPNEEMMLNDFKREMELNPAVESQYLELGGVDEVFDSRRARAIAKAMPTALGKCDPMVEVCGGMVSR